MHDFGDRLTHGEAPTSLRHRRHLGGPVPVGRTLVHG